MAICANENSDEFKALLKELGSPALAHAAWNRVHLNELSQTPVSIEHSILDNQKLVEGKTPDKDENGNRIESFYIINGEQYRRVTTVMPNDFDGDSNAHENSRIAGNTVDSIVREFFNTGATIKPEGITETAFDNIIKNLTVVKKQLDQRGERFLANNIVLFDTNLKIAGEVDILAIDKDGNYSIYDIKTSTTRGWSNYRSSYRGKLTKEETHTNQLSGYANLFFNQYGTKIHNLGVLPFELKYDKAGNIEEARGLQRIPIEYEASVGEYIPTSETYIPPPAVEVNPIYSKQRLSLLSRLKTLEKDMDRYDKSDPIYHQKLNSVNILKAELEILRTAPTEQGYENLGRGIITDANKFITDISASKKVRDRDLNYIKEIIDTWHNFAPLATEVSRLNERFQSVIGNSIVDKVNKHSTRDEPITLADIDNQDKDVSWWTGGTGSLADSTNYIANTIGLEIQTSQYKIAQQNVIDKNTIQEELNALHEYAESKGATLDDAWEILTDETNHTIELVKEFNTDGSQNAKWNHVQEVPELKRFYDFYQKMIDQKQSQSLYMEGGKYFIPNLSIKTAKGWIASKNPFKERKLGSGYEEDMSLDKVETKFHQKLAPGIKNKNLAYALLAFSMYSNNYAEMSAILPGLRVMQERLMYNKADPTKQKQFKSHNNPNHKINATDTNLWKMIDTIIDMQVLGKMKSDEGKFGYGTYTDTKGNLQEKYVDFGEIGDGLLRYNSLLRIGFSPISGGANVLFGDVTNTIEAVGGRFLTYKGLLQASKIFLEQFRNQDSDLARVHRELNFLQELDDYQYLEEVRLKGTTRGMSMEKMEEYAFGLQKAGENWIQTRIALAVMLKEQYITSEGKLTEKYTKASATEKQRLSSKIQRINHINHGRYTTKEAAAWHQNILFRAISQFRKWIPAAIENRFGAYNPHDNRLGVDTEGRYRTIGRKVFAQSLKDPIIALENLLLPIISAEKALKKGNLTEMEIYNMRKMMIEIILATASIVLVAALKSGTDDERRKRLKQPLVKTTLALLNRVSGDLTAFFDPATATDITTNIAPVNKLLVDLGKTVKYAAKGYPFYVNDWEITRGSNKGRNKFYKTVLGEIPLAKPIQDIIRLGSSESLEEQR
jgi:hypothetical protein